MCTVNSEFDEKIAMFYKLLLFFIVVLFYNFAILILEVKNLNESNNCRCGKAGNKTS